MTRLTPPARLYAWALRRWVRQLDREDAAEAAADFDRLRREAWLQSWAAWARVWAREARALRTTIRDERRGRDAGSRRGGPASWWSALACDVRHAARGLIRDGRIAILVIASLALGIGANGAAFELLDRLLVRGPDQLQDAASLQRVYRRVDRPPAGDETSPWLPYATYLHLRDESRAFESVGAYGVRDTVVGRFETARIRRVGMVLGKFFDTLRTRPEIGRVFAAADDAAADGPQAVLSDAFWQSEFRGDPSAIGKTLSADGVSYTIVGIAPPGFSGPELGRVDVWILGDTRTAPHYNWRVVGRLRRGVSASAAAADLASVQARGIDDEPKWMEHARLLVMPLGFDDTGRRPMQAQIARWMAGVSTMILLITCANVANLLLVRLTRRRRELAIRVALGSGRARLVRLVMSESVLLAAAGGGAAVWVAGAMLAAGGRALFPDGVGWRPLSIDSRLVLLVAAFTGAAGVMISLLPAVHTGGAGFASLLRDRSDALPGRSRVRAALTVIQAALSIVLLAGAGLFLRSLSRAAAVDLGCDPDAVILAEVVLDRVPVPADRAGFARYLADVRARQHAAYGRALESVRGLPGVLHASLTMGIPFDGGSFSTSLARPGADPIPALAGGGPYISAVTADYFATMGTRLLRGRPFGPSDGTTTEPVVIVGETAAARLWPDRDPLGQCIRIGDASACSRVVGIAQDVHRTSLREEPSLQVYVPYGQEHGFAGTVLLVRPAPGAALSFDALRRAVLADNPGVPLVNVQLLSDSLSGELLPMRLGMATFGGSAFLALLTAALGLYGLMSYVVAWRRREIGIRLALGASTAQISGLVVGGGLKLAAAGILLGLGITLAGGRLIQAQLFETSAADPAVLVTVAAVLLAVAAAAGALPARRALRIPAAESLRAD